MINVDKSCILGVALAAGASAARNNLSKEDIAKIAKFFEIIDRIIVVSAALGIDTEKFIKTIADIRSPDDIVQAASSGSAQIAAAIEKMVQKIKNTIKEWQDASLSLMGFSTNSFIMLILLLSDLIGFDATLLLGIVMGGPNILGTAAEMLLGNAILQLHAMLLSFAEAPKLLLRYNLFIHLVSTLEKRKRIIDSCILDITSIILILEEIDKVVDEHSAGDASVLTLLKHIKNAKIDLGFSLRASQNELTKTTSVDHVDFKYLEYASEDLEKAIKAAYGETFSEARDFLGSLGDGELGDLSDLNLVESFSILKGPTKIILLAEQAEASYKNLSDKLPIENLFGYQEHLKTIKNSLLTVPSNIFEQEDSGFILDSVSFLQDGYSQQVDTLKELNTSITSIENKVISFDSNFNILSGVSAKLLNKIYIIINSLHELSKEINSDYVKIEKGQKYVKGRPSVSERTSWAKTLLRNKAALDSLVHGGVAGAVNSSYFSTDFLNTTAPANLNEEIESLVDYLKSIDIEKPPAKRAYELLDDAMDGFIPKISSGKVKNTLSHFVEARELLEMQKNIDQSVSTHCNHIKILMEGMPAFELINMEFNKILNEVCDGEVFGPLLTALRNGDIGFLNAMLAEGGQLPGMCGIGLGDIPGVDALVEYTENLYGKFIDKLKGDRVKLANVTNTKVENLKDISAILSEISL